LRDSVVRWKKGMGMFLQCYCGYTLTDVASPGRIVHYLLSAHAIERLQDAVDQEVATGGIVRLWPEHWEAAGTAEAWLCPECSRLYVGSLGIRGGAPVRVFALERDGIEGLAAGIDSQLGSEGEVLALGMREAGESPLAPKPAEPGDSADGAGCVIQ
jgi:hypothetical protein